MLGSRCYVSVFEVAKRNFSASVEIISIETGSKCKASDKLLLQY